MIYNAVLWRQFSDYHKQKIVLVGQRIPQDAVLYCTSLLSRKLFDSWKSFKSYLALVDSSLLAKELRVNKLKHPLP